MPSKKKGMLLLFIERLLKNRWLKNSKKFLMNGWRHYDKEEQVFSQGMFDAKELMQQDVITISDDGGQYCGVL